MEGFKGTPGPWKLNPLTNPIDPYYYCVYIKTGGPETVQHITQVSGSGLNNKDEFKANAQLIAAAPELLEACIKAKEVFKQLADADKYPEPLMQDNGGEGMQFLTNAITKALGGNI